MNNTAYLIECYLRNNGVRYMAEFDDSNGVRLLWWLDAKDWEIKYEVTIEDDKISMCRYLKKYLSVSGQITTYQDFKGFFLETF